MKTKNFGNRAPASNPLGSNRRILHYLQTSVNSHAFTPNSHSPKNKRDYTTQSLGLRQFRKGPFSKMHLHRYRSTRLSSITTSHNVQAPPKRLSVSTIQSAPSTMWLVGQLLQAIVITSTAHAAQTLPCSPGWARGPDVKIVTRSTL